MLSIKPDGNTAGLAEDNPPAAKPPLLVRRLMQITGWPMQLLSLGLLLQICRYARFPIMSWSGVGLYLGWFLLIGAWVVLRGALWLSYRSEPTIRNLWHWSLPPALLVLGYVLPHSGLPCRWSFEMNRPAFDRLAQQVMESPASPHTPSIGPYDTSNVAYEEPTPGSKAGAEVVITLSRTGYDLSRFGFAYHPDGRPHNEYDYDLGGGWYAWSYVTQ